MGGGPTRERGRPARMHSRRVPLSSSAMAHAATLTAETAWARPKQSPGATRERGRLARMLFRRVSLSFPAMGHPAPCRQERH